MNDNARRSDGPSLFISYSHRDEEWKKEVIFHLRAAFGRHPDVELWCDRDIRVGDAWRETIDQALDRADAAILLVSTYFLASDFIQDEEIPRILARHQAEGVDVFPLLIRFCPWQENHDWLASLQMRPTDAKPLNSLDEAGAEGALAAFASEVVQIVGSTPPPRPAPPPADPVIASDPLDAWFDHVEAEHRRLADCFDRPGRMGLIEEAWVELDVRPDLKRLSRDGDAEDSRWAGEKLTLADALALSSDDAPWITGRWLLEGPPGSGKTTMLRYRARELAAARDPTQIPLFVSLSRVTDRDDDWLTTVTESFRNVGTDGIVDALRVAGEQGHLVIFLDGLDEVPPGRRDRVKGLQRFLGDQWPRCKVVLSTRPLGRGEIPGDFPRLDLLPLERERQLDFLTQWLRHAGQDGAERAARDALAAIRADRRLCDLAGVPLYLTLFAVLIAANRPPPNRIGDLYDLIFELLLEGRHRADPVPIHTPVDVRDALRHLALGMTWDDHWAESPSQLERRLRDPGLDKVRARLEKVSPWDRSLRLFLSDVHEQTQILGPHDGQGEDWRFWHRTFREALTAERLWHQHDEGDIEAVVGWAKGLPDDQGAEGSGEGRWAEPLALLAGRLDEPDALVVRLAEVKPALALRSMVFTDHLRPETLVETLGLTGDLDDRIRVFETIPGQLGDPHACLALVEQLKEGRPAGFDFLWMSWILDQVAERWPGLTRISTEAQSRLFEHLPPPDPALFETIETSIDGQVDLWRTIPAGEGWLGSPGEVGYYNERPRHRIEVVQDFALGAVPVTNAQYALFDPSRADLKLPGHPVVSITWYESVAFCRWLATAARFTGARLPTEAEWEYACRAGSGTAYWKGDSEEALDAVGWYYENSGGSVHAIGEKPANPWGLYDVHGNVWEWTGTPWHGEREQYQGRSRDAPSALDPSAQPDDVVSQPRVGRVFRGGSFGSTADAARSAFRTGWRPGLRWRSRGFRVVLPLPPASRT